MIRLMSSSLAAISLATTLAACSGSSGSGTQLPPIGGGEPPPTAEPGAEPGTPTVQAPEAGRFISFESAPVRPIASSADGSRLYVVNTTDNHLEIFDVAGDGLVSHRTSVPVGLEPVAVATAPDGSAWVVNHLSDSISVVDVAAAVPVVRDTLLVGDEPRDIVFARGRAFVTTAHRGQHRTHDSIAAVPGTGDPQLHTASIPRADVWVFDARNPGGSLGGIPLSVVELFGDTPRALAVSADGATVYAAVLNSGNQTSAVHESIMCFGFVGDGLGGDQPCQVMDGISSPAGLADGWLPGGRPGTGFNAEGDYQPWTATMVSYDRDSGEWRDVLGRNFSNGIRFHLPDLDVFAIDAQTLEPQEAYAHAGTTLFNMVANPVSGRLYVTNTDANNAVPFEGPGEHAGTTVQGNIARAQITVIDGGTGDVAPRHLNRHIDYTRLKAGAGVKDASVATPTQMAVSADGQWLYVAALGSDRVAVYPTAQLEGDHWWDGRGDEFDPYEAATRHIDVPQGPAGLLLDERRGPGGTLFVLTRFDNSLVVIDASTGQERQRAAMFTAEPQAVRDGRFMLYDARRSSSNGEASCASCHVFGDTDHLSWDLGNPDAGNTRNSNPFPTARMTRLNCDFIGPNDPGCQFLGLVNGNGNLREFASNKGPMFTQTLRGMSTHGHMHWRGDRVTGYFGTDEDPDGDGNIDTGDTQDLDERLSFKNFIVAFEGLLGLDVDLENDSRSADVAALERDMDKFADFALALQMPPNPIRNLDNSHSASGLVGADFFSGPRRSDGLDRDYASNGPQPDGQTCEGCHGLDPARGFYGTRGEVAHGGEILILKVPQLRNMYQKIGMFGLPDRREFLPSHTREHQGDQVRGFGFLHDGATDLLFNFLKGGVFDDGEKGCPPGLPANHGCEFNVGAVGIVDDHVRQGLVDFLYEFDTDLAPIVGQQVTLSAGVDRQRGARLDLLEERAAAPFVSKILGGEVTECDLVARGVLDGKEHSFAYIPGDRVYLPAAKEGNPLTSTQLRDRAGDDGNAMTFTCVPPGSGYRLGLDRNGDGAFNHD